MVEHPRPAGSGAAVAPWPFFRSSASTSQDPPAPGSESKGGGRHSSDTNLQRKGPCPARPTSTRDRDMQPDGSDAVWLGLSKGSGQEGHIELKTKMKRIMSHIILSYTAY